MNNSNFSLSGGLICFLLLTLLKLYPTVRPKGDYQLSCTFYLSTYPAAARGAQNVTEVRTKSKGIPKGVNLSLTEELKASYTNVKHESWVFLNSPVFSWLTASVGACQRPVLTSKENHAGQAGKHTWGERKDKATTLLSLQKQTENCFRG